MKIMCNTNLIKEQYQINILSSIVGFYLKILVIINWLNWIHIVPHKYLLTVVAPSLKRQIDFNSNYLQISLMNESFVGSYYFMFISDKRVNWIDSLVCVTQLWACHNEFGVYCYSLNI